jgi:hypothetical protein
MARIRSVHPGMASDEAFMSMSMAAKAAWPLLWTECDDHGVFEWKPLVLKARIFPADNVDFRDILDEYEQLGCVKMFEVRGKSYGCVRNFCRYQKPKKPTFKLPFPDELGTYAGLTAGSSEAVENQFGTGTEKPSLMEMEDGIGEGEGRKQERAREPSVELKVSIVKAFEKANSPNTPDTSRVDVWIAQGYRPEIILPVITGIIGRKPSISTLSYFDAAIRDAHAQQASRAASPAEPEWEKFLSMYASNKIWPLSLGPEPGYSGCRAPSDLLRKHGYEPEAA